MYKKSSFIMLLSIISAFSLLLAGCGTRDNGTSVSTVGTAEPNQQPIESAHLIISAAASMTDVLTEIQKNYAEVNPSVKLSFNFGGSGALQRQIEQGAPADLFISAAVKNMKELVEEQLIDLDQQVNLLRNELVIVVSSDSPVSIGSMEDLTKGEVKMVAIGIPESVPAGNYAKEALLSVNLWDDLQSRTVQAKDVRQVLQYIETGNADAGFVYKTDAITTDKVKIAYKVDESAYKPIVYPIGIVKATKHFDAAEAFYQYLQEQEALNVFIKYGFSIVK